MKSVSDKFSEILAEYQDFDPAKKLDGLIGG
jgi:hypothetical protein